MALEALQASLTITPVNTFGTAAWQVASALMGAIAEQLMVGTVVSLTVKVDEQVALLPAASVAGTVTDRAAIPTHAPAVCRFLSEKAMEALQASLTVTPAR